MFSQYLYRLRQYSRQLWVRAALITALAILAAALAPLLTPLVPFELISKIEEDTVRSLLDILANSMLAVTTFSLTIMVTAHLSASQQVTPRAHRVLREDGRTQSVLATFVGAFVYSLAGIVMIQLGFIAKEDLALLYVTTLAVLGLIIVSILRWIGRLALIGSLEETTRKVEAEARTALERRLSNPFMGGRPLVKAEIPENGQSVLAVQSGYVQHIDTVSLSELVDGWDATLYLLVSPGDWVGSGDALAVISLEDLSDDQSEAMHDNFTVGDARTFAQDAAFGVTVLTEIAERALSPAMNDPMTATDIIARLVLLLEDADEERPVDDPQAPNVQVAALDVARLVERGFDPIARDGKGFVEIQLHVQTALRRLASHRNSVLAEAARVQSRRALTYAELGLALAADVERVRAVAEETSPVTVNAAYAG